MAKYYIGIDGGGSKTKYLCMDADGRECGSALTLGTYCEQDGIDVVIGRLKEGIRQCLPEGKPPPPILAGRYVLRGFFYA